ncbi:ubiquitin carboxyl-terminal hydrolase 31 [Parasteatoda tepidariorum]|uniref:ubiquitin carboxyl-terminal hydrolase 31 n=1 Tax=Parasteatoda tepidariorum TaxID=114398 RepID=UPI00077FAA39|nr:ubiquitin carboxyl-terminal hydrolase 31 [Parasteatoda tepidariorum]
MSNSQYADCGRSVSDGDLADVSQKKRHSSGRSDALNGSIDKQVFFTLPRWMSVRKKRSRIKYIKVDVPFTSENHRNQYGKGDDFSKSYVQDKKSNSFIRKFFRSSSFFTSESSQKSSRSIPRTPTFPAMSTSNSDIRNCNDFAFYSFDYHEYFKNKNPAVCGIKNHGNTCFMNAVIQCLSNTDSFAEYFVLGNFKMDLLRRNKAHSKKYGTRGEVTDQLGTVLSSLWTCQYIPNISNKFKTLVAKYGDQYDGSDQHDAQEFLLWLLDKVHEDLNIAPKQKYKKSKGNLGRSDEDIAAETLANHLRCNSSFIHDLFQGQFRSSLCCLGCGHFSNTFDPYLCVSLPVPHYQKIPIVLYIVKRNEDIKIDKVGLTIESQATVLDLQEKLNTVFGTPVNNVMIAEIVDGKFGRTFNNSDPVSCFGEKENIYVIETPLPNLNTSAEQEKLVLIIVNQLETTDGYNMLWRPFVLSVLREISYSELENEIFSAMNCVFKENFNVNSESFSIVITGQSISEKICSSVDMPLYMPAIDQALQLSSDGIPHIKLYIQWKKDVKDMLQSELSFIEEHSSVEEARLFKKSGDEVSLYECFDLYFNEERLGVEDARMCPYCHHRLPCVKTLSLWSIPDVFIVHLKRFRQSSSQRVKNTTVVNFPLTGLDMNPYVAERSNPNTQVPSNSLAPVALWSPWKRSRSHLYTRWEDNVYELYAVCNHQGSMQAGHYTAYCRNPVSGQWYLYDDIKVQKVPVTEVVSADAYILFYQRSSLSSLSCASSSSSGYSSASSANSVGPDHWAFRMSPLFRDMQMNTKSQDNLFDVGKTSSLDRRSSLHRPFSRSSKAYSTVHHNGSSTLPHSHTRTFPNADQSSSQVISANKIKEEIPPPPPPVKHYWTVTSV